MRADIDLDDALLAEAMRLTGLPTKEAVIEEALRRLIRQHRQRKAIANTAGMGWEGDLDVMRESRSAD